MMIWLKLKLAIGIGAAALLVGSTATVALSGNLSRSPSTDKQSVTNSQQILIATLLLKTPTADVDAVINDFANSNIPINLNSEMLRNLLKQHPEVECLGMPRILTVAGREAIASITKPVQIDGTNTEVGIIVDVTPTVKPGSKISLQIRCELRELVDGVSPSIRVTKSDEQTQPVTWSNKTIVIRKTIGDDSQTIGKNPNDKSQTLLVFVNATWFHERLQKNIIKRTQP